MVSQSLLCSFIRGSAGHSPVYMYDLGIFCMPTFSAYENTKISTTKIWSQIFLDRFCSSFVFQSRICLVLGFWWHLYKSLYLSLSWCWFLYCTLCRLSTEFSGNSKQGLYFCCKVWTLAVFLEAVETYISDYFHWEQVKKWKYTNLSKNKSPKSNNFPKVCSYLCLSVDRSVYRSSASHLFSNLFVSSKMLFLIEFFSRGFVGHSLGPCITCLHVHMLQSRVWFILKYNFCHGWHFV